MGREKSGNRTLGEQHSTYKHGLSNTHIYWIWQAIKDRCLNPKNKGYKNYGGRGIKVCERWISSDGFKNFYNDMGNTYKKGLQLDRIDNNGNYEPLNCRWTNTIVQANNKNRVKHALGYKKHKGGYQASICINGRSKHIGLYKNKEEAHNAYLVAQKDKMESIGYLELMK